MCNCNWLFCSECRDLTNMCKPAVLLRGPELARKTLEVKRDIGTLDVKENFGRRFRWLTVVCMPNNGGLLSYPALFWVFVAFLKGQTKKFCLSVADEKELGLRVYNSSTSIPL